MFTGLIQDVGAVIANSGDALSRRLAISSSLPFHSFELGGSVCCNGACLTLVEKHAVPATGETILEFDVGPQTLSLTALGTLVAGGLVNLERALKLGDELGGHQVSGHVDCLGKVVKFSQGENGFWVLGIQVAEQFAKFLVPQGSVAVKGVSLTLAKVSTQVSGIFEIMLVPHTLAKTNLQNLQVGDVCEIEFCSMVKSVSHLLELMLPKLVSEKLR